jgi:SAM-dependent methyltransferase
MKKYFWRLWEFPLFLLPKSLVVFSNPENYHILKFIKSIPMANNQELLLDAGAGDQNKKALLVSKSYFYESCDFEDIFESNSLIKQTYVCSVEKLVMEDQRYDVVFSCQVLEHLQNPELAISEMGRVLKKGGKLYLSTNFLYPRHGKPYDYFRFTEDGLISLALKSNLDIFEIKARGGLPAFLSQMVSEFPTYFRNFQIFGSSNPSFTSKPKKSRLPLVLVLILPTLIFNLTCLILSLFIHLFDFMDKEKRYTLGYAMVAIRK